MATISLGERLLQKIIIGIQHINFMMDQMVIGRGIVNIHGLKNTMELWMVN